ncbi:hypothetical protein GOBAR_DD22170 [Gossypium barbadense]|nr:hypothetical protein GOBAR_DD22170 [Gossypium barbadense]
MGIVKFDDPSSAENSLPNHFDKGINAIIESTGRRIKTDVAEVKTPLMKVRKKMVEGGLITQDLGEKPGEARNYCEFYDEEGYEIQKCNEFRSLVQGLMDNKKLEKPRSNKNPFCEIGSYINDMSDAATDQESSFERDMCLEGSQDFQDDRDCNLSPDLLRIVEREEKQIPPHKETGEIMILEEGKEVKIRAWIVT